MKKSNLLNFIFWIFVIYITNKYPDLQLYLDVFIPMFI